MKLLGTLLLVALAVPLHADEWTYFHPESVTNFSCSVSAIQLETHGVAEKRMQWVAKASADRSDTVDKWAMEIGVFPMNNKGRHAAEKVCSQWVDKASRRVREAQAIRVGALVGK